MCHSQPQQRRLQHYPSRHALPLRLLLLQGNDSPCRKRWRQGCFQQPPHRTRPPRGCCVGPACTARGGERHSGTGKRAAQPLCRSPPSMTRPPSTWTASATRGERLPQKPPFAGRTARASILTMGEKVAGALACGLLPPPRRPSLTAAASWTGALGWTAAPSVAAPSKLQGAPDRRGARRTSTAASVSSAARAVLRQSSTRRLTRSRGANFKLKSRQ